MVPLWRELDSRSCFSFSESLHLRIWVFQSQERGLTKCGNRPNHKYEDHFHNFTTLQRTPIPRGLGLCCAHQRLRGYQLRPMGPGTKDHRTVWTRNLAASAPASHLVWDTGNGEPRTIAPALRFGGTRGSVRKGSGPSPACWGVLRRG